MYRIYRIYKCIEYIEYNRIYYITGDTKSYNNNNTDKLVPMECDQESNDTTDFTVDISLDQFDGQKEVTDEDVMHHLDVIENIELDETFGVDECMKETNQLDLFIKEKEKSEEDKDEITVIEEEEPIDEKWYERKVY